MIAEKPTINYGYYPTNNLLKKRYLNMNGKLSSVNFHFEEGLLLRCWYDWLISWLLISRSSGNIVHGENKFTNKVKCDTGNDLQTDVLITTRWSMVYRIWTYFSCKVNDHSLTNCCSIGTAASCVWHALLMAFSIHEKKDTDTSISKNIKTKWLIWEIQKLPALLLAFSIHEKRHRYENK